MKISEAGDKSKGKEMTEEVDKAIIHTCHILQNINIFDGISMQEYASVTGALANLVEARAHLDKKEQWSSYIPMRDARINGITKATRRNK